MKKIVIEKLSVSTLFLTIIKKQRQYVVYVRITYLAYNLLKVLPVLNKIKYVQLDSALKKFNYRISKEKLIQNRYVILNRLMKEYNYDMSSISEIIGIDDNKAEHQIKLYSWNYFYHVSEGISVANFFKADELIVSSRLGRGVIRSAFNKVIFINDFLDHSKVIIRKKYSHDSMYEIHFVKKIVHLLCMSLLLLFISFISKLKKRGSINKPNKIGIRILKDIIDENTSDILWINKKTRLTKPVLFIEREQSNNKYRAFDYLKINTLNVIKYIFSLKDGIPLSSCKIRSINLKRLIITILRNNQSFSSNIVVLHLTIKSIFTAILLEKKEISILYDRAIGWNYPHVMATDMLNIIHISGTWSNVPLHQILYSTSSDVTFVWNKMVQNNFIRSNSLKTSYINVGMPSKMLLKSSANMANKIFNKEALRGKVVLGFLDSNYVDDCYATTDMMMDVFHLIIDLMEGNDRLFLVYKPRDIEHVKKYFPEIMATFEELIKQGRCIVLNEGKSRPNVTVIGCISDLVVAGPTISSAATECMLTGVATIHIHLIQGTENHDLIDREIGRSVFCDVNNAKNKIRDLLGCRDYTVGFPDDLDFYIGNFDDRTKNLEAEYILLLHDGVNNNMSKSEIISNANNKFADLHGENMVIH